MKLFLIMLMGLTMFACAPAYAQSNDKVQSMPILSAATSTGAASSVIPWKANRTFQGSGTTSSGAGAASILIQVSNDNSNWDLLGTITLTLGTASTSDSFTSISPYRYVRANVDSISGTGASVDVYMGTGGN